MDYRQLVELAFEVRENAYAPYSGFKSGAALLCKDGEVFTGCNIEIASFTPSVSAGQAAIINAAVSGNRNFKAIAIVGGSDENICFCSPDGATRQTLEEFCDRDDFEIILAKSMGEYVVYTFDDLYPVPFSKNTVIG